MEPQGLRPSGPIIVCGAPRPTAWRGKNHDCQPRCCLHWVVVISFGIEGSSCFSAKLIEMELDSTSSYAKNGTFAGWFFLTASIDLRSMAICKFVTLPEMPIRTASWVKRRPGQRSVTGTTHHQGDWPRAIAAAVSLHAATVVESLCGPAKLFFLYQWIFVSNAPCSCFGFVKGIAVRKRKGFFKSLVSICTWRQRRISYGDLALSSECTSEPGERRRQVCTELIACWRWRATRVSLEFYSLDFLRGTSNFSGCYR